MKLFTLVADLTLDTAGFVTQVANAKSEGKSLAEAIGADSESIKTSFSDAFSFAAGDLLADAVREGLRAMGEFVGESVGVASDMEETNSKIDAIFGSMSQNVHNWARTTKDQFGIGEFAAKGYAGQLASLLSADSLELTTEQIYEMSTGLVELAGDLASFHNMSFDTVWTKLLSGMRGETEAIEDLGVDVRASAMAAYLGIATDDWGKLDQQTRTLATYDYILENTTVAQGDFVRTQDQYANQMRIFNENITQLKAQLGEGLLPVMTDLVTWFNSFFDTGKEAGEVTDDIRSDFVDTALEIQNTATAATALVNALAEFEEGGFTSDEKSQWDALVSSLSADLPLLSEAIGQNNGVIEQGSEALASYVEEWKNASIEIGQANAMAEYNEEIGRQQAITGQAKYDMDAAFILAQENEKQWNQVWLDVIDYVNLMLDPSWGGALASDVTDVLANPNLVSDYLYNLQEWGSDGDTQAQGYFDLLNRIQSSEDAWAKYEEASAKYEVEMSKLEALQSQKNLLLEAINAISSGLTNQEPPVVEVTVNNTANDNLIVSKVEQRISRNARNKSLTVAVAK